MIGVGDKVVCLKNSNAYAEALGVDAAFKGEIYTVKGITRPDSFGNPCILLEEICTNNNHGDGREWGYQLKAFRPVQTTKTDIAIFQAMDRNAFGRKRVVA